MSKYIFSVIFLIVLIGLQGCNERLTDATDEVPIDEQIEVPDLGDDSTLEIASWNIERFPKNGQQSVNSVRELILDMDIDIFAIQEITDVGAFNDLVASLDEYDGRVGTGAAGFALWPGIIYKKDVVSIESEDFLFRNDGYSFPRAPYLLEIRATANNLAFDFNLIILHLKASGGTENEARRRSAIQLLENYVEAQLQDPNADHDFVIAGDWNDLLDDTGNRNVYLPFLTDSSNYRFLTEPFAGSQTEYSFIGGNFRSLLDHIMITSAIDTVYNNIGIEILKPDQVFPQYDAQVSDHRPVVATLPVF